MFAAPLFFLLALVNDKMLVSTDWLAAHLRDRSLTIVHVGATPDAYRGGHIPGAVFLAIDELAVTRGGVPAEVPSLDKLTKTFELLGIGNRGRIVICGDTPLLAARLFYTLDYIGHGHRIALLDGGFAQWKRENRALETVVPVSGPELFNARLHPEQLVYMSQLKKVVPSDSLVLVDARAPEQFAGKEAGADVSRPGHIPGAINIAWTATVGADEKLLPVVELQKLHEHIDRAKPVVTYCRTGMQSAFEYFVLRYLGYNVAMYDGAYVEWANDPATNVE